MYLHTCNRVCFFISSKSGYQENFTTQFFRYVNPELEACNTISADQYEGADAIKHMTELAASLDSMVLGEREILRQLRTAYEEAQQMNLTGDDIRLAMKFIIPAAKKIYTETKIAEKPVSVVSLAALKLDALAADKNAAILFIGAGETNQKMAAHLLEYGYHNFVVFNRSQVRGQELAKKLNCAYYPLSSLKDHRAHFDIIISCISLTEPLLTASLYHDILQNDQSKKIIVDLAVPFNTERTVAEGNNVQYIDIGSLKHIAEKNMASRRSEKIKAKKLIQEFIREFESIYIQRSIEKAHARIPELIHAIHEKATAEVFVKEISAMDETSRQTLLSVMDYMEKKYIALTIASAKEAAKYKI